MSKDNYRVSSGVMGKEMAQEATNLRNSIMAVVIKHSLQFANRKDFKLPELQLTVMTQVLSSLVYATVMATEADNQVY